MRAETSRPSWPAMGCGRGLIEQALEPHHEARATSLKPGVLEILDSVGVVEPLLDAAVHLHGSRMYDAALYEFGVTRLRGAGLPL